jgi:hypothetical protein
MPKIDQVFSLQGHVEGLKSALISEQILTHKMCLKNIALTSEVEILKQQLINQEERFTEEIEHLRSLL